MFAGLVGLIAAALFSGAALYINVAEQPARLRLDDSALLGEWKAAYAAGARMQAPLAGLGFLLGAIAWWQTGLPAFAFAGLAMLANMPWTLIVILPVNQHLSKTDVRQANPETRALIQRGTGCMRCARSLVSSPWLPSSSASAREIHSLARERTSADYG